MIDEIIVGDTLDFDTEVADYSAADGYVLHYRLVPRVSGTPITIDCITADDGVAHRAQVANSVTAAWTAGNYSWYSYVTKTGERYTVDNGNVVLKPDPAVSTAPQDNRSHARIVLDAIEAVIANRATKDQQEYQIGDRMLKNVPMMELLQFRMQYKAEVRGEEMPDRIANKTGSNRILTRL